MFDGLRFSVWVVVVMLFRLCIRSIVFRVFRFICVEYVCFFFFVWNFFIFCKN